MKKFVRMVKSFYKNIIVKKKFKSYFMSVVDREYRAQLNRLYALTKDASNKTELQMVPVRALVPGHKIVYPEYERMLFENDHIEIEPIKVFKEHTGYYRVVDGNHRLQAIKKRAISKNEGHVICKVMI